MELETLLKTDEFKKTIREIVREQMSVTYQDMDEIRRSPAGSIIRIEEEIKSIKQNMVTKEEFRRKFAELEGRFTGLESKTSGVEGRLAGLEGKTSGLEGNISGLLGKISGLEGRMNLLIGLIFVMLTLYGALVVKLIFFP